MRTLVRLHGQAVGLESLTVAFEPDRRFTVVRDGAAGARLAGRWTIVAGHVACAVVVRRRMRGAD